MRPPPPFHGRNVSASSVESTTVRLPVGDFAAGALVAAGDADELEAAGAEVAAGALDAADELEDAGALGATDELDELDAAGALVEAGGTV